MTTRHKTSRNGKYTLLWNNTITIMGLFFSSVGIILLLTFALFSLVTEKANPYGVLVGYLIVPSILIIGLVLIPFGILLKSWRLRRRNPEQPLVFRFPHVDLNDPAHRRAAKIVVFGTLLFLPVLGLLGYHGHRYTDSRAFCAQVCHTVMRPQSVTHLQSAHAQVACARCHMGSESSWFVKSKLSGIPQVLAVIQNTFPRPIPAEISELRPSPKTCMQCHWPEKFFGAQMKKIIRYASDAFNTRREIDMLIRTGGYETTAQMEGIHKHMALTGRIEYVATDEKLEEIPWIRYIDDIGNETIYRSDGISIPEPPSEANVRKFDCMDCHNRPAHRFRSPQDMVDVYLSTERIDPDIPFIKREAVSALVNTYEDLNHAENEIEKSIAEFYRANYTDQWETLEKPVVQAIAMIQEIHQRNFFPEMNVQWQTYPDHIGHLYSPGCFRCHDGQHVSQDGITISHRCDLCHTFLNVAGGADGTLYQEGEFAHSFKLDDSHATLRCDQCHTGGISALFTCERCHE